MTTNDIALFLAVLACAVWGCTLRYMAYVHALKRSRSQDERTND